MTSAYYDGSMYAHTRTHTHLDIAHSELVEAVGEHVPCLLVGAIANIGHQASATEPPPNAVVNSLWLPPVALHRKGTRLVLVSNPDHFQPPLFMMSLDP